MVLFRVEKLDLQSVLESTVAFFKLGKLHSSYNVNVFLFDHKKQTWKLYRIFCSNIAQL